MNKSDRIPGFAGLGLAVCLVASSLFVACSLPGKLTSDRHALLIGINDYIYFVPDDDLSYPRADAETLGALLDLHGWAADYTTLIDTNATKAKIKAKIETYFKGIPADATALIYFSGHGDAASGEAYLVPSDYQSSGPDKRISTAELSQWIQSYILPYSNNIIVIIDACYSGGFVPQSDSLDIIDPDFDVNFSYSASSPALAGLSDIGALLARNLDHSGILEPIILSAAGFDELSWETGELKHGVFTYYLLKAAGNGDTNRDGYVSTTEAYTYAAKSIDKSWNDLYGNSNAFYPHITGGLRDLVLFDLH
jgi:hypothetical protein